MEIWRDIKGFEGFYKISDMGNIKSLERKVTYKTRGSSFRTDVIKEKILKPQKSHCKYLTVTLYGANRKPKQFLLHRLIAETFVPNPENKKEVNHKDGNKLNNSLNNLEWCTRSENATHMVKNGLCNFKLGSESPNSKFSQEDADKIRSEYLNGKISQSKLGKKYGVAQGTISTIIRNKRYIK